MVAHDPLLADAVLGAAACTPALPKLFGFITAGSPGSLCIVSLEIWEKEKESRKGKKLLPFTYQQRTIIFLQLMWSSSFFQDVLLFCQDVLLYNCIWIFLFSSCRRDFLPGLRLASSARVTFSCRPFSSVNVALGEGRRRGLQGGIDDI